MRKRITTLRTVVHKLAPRNVTCCASNVTHIWELKPPSNKSNKYNCIQCNRMNLLSIIWIHKRRSYSNHSLTQPSMPHFNRVPKAIVLPYPFSCPTSDLIGDVWRRCCQTNEPKHQYLVDGYFYEITKERHSVRAASRFSLNVLRFESDLCELNRLWNEAWMEANFCRLCIRLNRSMALSRRRKGKC